MTKKHTKLAFACLSALLICAGCVEENLDEQNRLPALDGDEITFGARAGFENSGPNTKTIYGGEGDFGYYTDDNGRVIESIRWNYDTDKIQIYCPESESTGFAEAHYKVLEGQDNTGNSYSYLQKTGDASIRWANETTPHNFYAMYPSNEMFEGDEAVTLKSGVKMVGTTLNATIPVSQSPEGALIRDKRKDVNGIETEFTQYTAKPNMNFAYMAAKTTGVTKLDKNGNVQGVSLTFVPIVTAVQIELSMPSKSGIDYDDINIGEIYIEGTNIAGDFTADLNNWDPSSTSSPYPSCTNVNGSNKITVSTWQIDENNNRVPLLLKDGESLVFTVFLSPAAGTNGIVSNLKITYSEVGGNGPSKTMTGVNIRPHIKTVIKAFKLPEEAISIDNSKWVEVLPDDVELGGLSIPGSGNTFSYNHSDNAVKSQTLYFKHQWKQGIRAFEITSDQQKTLFKDEVVKCNAEPMGLTISNVFDSLKTQLSTYPDEFALVILNYQSEGSTYPRDVPAYASKVAKFYDDYTAAYREEVGDPQAEIFKLYSPGLKLSDVRGKIMLVMRTTQEDEDPVSDFYGTTQDGQSSGGVINAIGTRNILAVDGCGSGKDKWRRRGYTVNGVPALNIWDSGGNDAVSEGVLIENYLVGTGSSNNADAATWAYSWEDNVEVPENYGGNFSYYCTTGNSETSFRVWYQEWARVVPEGGVIYSAGNCRPSMLSNERIYYFVKWRGSYNEKLTHAKKAFASAINGDNFDVDGDQVPDSHVFINSLCGYFVDNTSTYSNSCIPWMESPCSHSHFLGGRLSWDTGGLKGNIAALATRINNDFYNYVLSAGLDQTSGPTGVVMMDRVSNKSADGGSYYLPGVIIGNNFKY